MPRYKTVEELKAAVETMTADEHAQELLLIGAQLELIDEKMRAMGISTIEFDGATISVG